MHMNNVTSEIRQALQSLNIGRLDKAKSQLQALLDNAEATDALPVSISLAQGGAIAVLERLLKYVDAETCHHEDTYRGGAIWTVCRGCGKQWADDRGGFTPYEDPQQVAEARAFLAQLQQTTGKEMEGSRG